MCFLSRAPGPHQAGLGGTCRLSSSGPPAFYLGRSRPVPCPQRWSLQPLRGWIVHCGPSTRTSRCLPASRHRGSKFNPKRSQPRHWGGAAVLGLATSATRCAHLAPRRTQSKGPESMCSPAQQHYNSGFFLEPGSILFALPLVFRMVLMFSFLCP